MTGLSQSLIALFHQLVSRLEIELLQFFRFGVYRALLLGLAAIVLCALCGLPD